ncbi:hypothetical protein I4F81_010598 [Pyropia yezoensis]|uniref:Uncharacterized protein n=1 Tax=Pyropia yezoensis TaxID=2788 RepID=A0ACC3CDE4_PYRYE|nr:hypothetical protein I4F81_010598 [Neopyropia yezoensis]
MAAPAPPAVPRPLDYLLAGRVVAPRPLDGDLTTLRNQLAYVRFIVDAQVTELGLLAFLTAVLDEHGPLLIGEIGQHLRATFGRHDWGVLLRERFGGLKRFLLRHADVFLVDTDHPLNPHIYLRSEEPRAAHR